ncbi:hypothetical protein VM98_24070 [Streptomyces rubellomurinus subsp. indigoferus]|uniref:EthD domain-containing protein n=1 Tax=Streptomyces rubellomurinus (strain ATCC 31215) TaxID=359131 RepID=A0A0F2TGM6_STRR3|nr:hypothetical protein [Streptomyces rubellomurinus]KJS53632.1 hypothetical protein VM98_24070 [Streptomyces rubellomurinus subsp. indigoferus]KJS62383.1 hypothetical protein VM95_09420 [Streptomyces rubellomurinus]
MRLIAVMVRKLNEGVSYEEFRKAWIPDEVIADDPRTKVISATALEDSRELITVALIEGDHTPESMGEWMEKMAPIEARRYERIKDLVGPPTLNAVYQVQAEDNLSQQITA